jgi:hypothetical protein
MFVTAAIPPLASIQSIYSWERQKITLSIKCAKAAPEAGQGRAVYAIPPKVPPLLLMLFDLVR